MGKITVETCEIEGLKVITPAVFGDERGYFMETYNYNDYRAAGIDMEFVQDNQSSSKKGVLRDCIFRSIIRRISWCAWSAGKCLTSRSISVRGQRHTENGSVWFCRQRIKTVLYSEELCARICGALRFR